MSENNEQSFNFVQNSLFSAKLNATFFKNVKLIINIKYFNYSDLYIKYFIVKPPIYGDIIFQRKRNQMNGLFFKVFLFKVYF